MDTLKVQIVDTSQFYSSITFYTLIIASISLLISGWAVFLQYRRGDIIIPPIRSFGTVFILNTMGRNHKITAHEISGIMFVVPILIYNTGNKHIGITDVRLMTKSNNKEYYFKFNQFANDLGITSSGARSLPKSTDWAHQFVVQPKGTVFYYLEFILKENFQVLKKILENDNLKISIQIKTSTQSKYKSFQHFTMSLDDNRRKNLVEEYLVYEAEDN